MTQRETVLAMLERGPCTTADFLQARVPRFSARIQELRDSGHSITSEKVREGSWRYELQAREPMALVLDYRGGESKSELRPMREVIHDWKESFVAGSNPQRAK